MAKKPIVKNQMEFQNQDSKKLYDFLVQRFDAHDRKFEAIDKKLISHDKKFDAHDKRFDANEKRLDKMEMRLDLKFEWLDEKKADKQDIYDLRDEMITHINGLAKKIDDYRTEQAMIMSQLNRHEKWHFRVAAKVGIDLLDN